jgi:3-hydroxyacyl-CoA dehydrogenase
MHFFNPVHRMPLVEVIEGRNTSAEAVQAVVAFCSRLGKVPVVIQDSPGFLVNRILMLYIGEALWLLNEGHSIAEIDQAMTDWGMPLGPLALIDTVGLDVAAKVAQILARTFPDRLALPPWVDNLAVADRLGVKTGLGFYSYDGPQRSKPDQEVYELLGLARAKKGLEPSRLVERMVLPMVNEAARCLEERLVGSPSDLDLAMILGAGFPPFRGGLCRWADSQGLEQLGASLEELAAGTGARFAPAAGLARAIQGGGLYPTYG